MNTSNRKRLQQKYEEDLSICKGNIAQWEKLKKDYESLSETIRTLPEKTSHDMMVPLGPLALVPGKVVHTNEVFVLLGDNWYAERSCKQACGIIERRLKQCDTMLAKYHEEEGNIKNWIGFAEEPNESQDLVDLVEEYDDEKEAVWRDQHKKNVQKYHKQLAEARNQMQNMSTQSCLPEDTIQEESQTQTNIASTSSAGGYGDTVNVYRNKGRRVSWQDQSDAIPKHFTQDDDVEESENDDDASPLTIHFTHTNFPDSIHFQSDDSNNVEDASYSGEVTNPADIYVKYGHFFQKTPKSILKRRESNSRGVDAETQPSIQIIDPQSIKSSSPTPVVIQQSIVERNPIDQPSASSVNRPTSRFKAQRLSAQKKT